MGIVWNDIYEWMLDKDEMEMEAFGPRHNNWDELRDEILSRPGVECMGCGSKKGLTVHHIKPFSTHPELELVEQNLVVVCHKSDRFKNWSCHKTICHFNNWQNINENAIRDLSYFRRNFDKMIKDGRY